MSGKTPIDLVDPYGVYRSEKEALAIWTELGNRVGKELKMRPHGYVPGIQFIVLNDEGKEMSLVRSFTSKELLRLVALVDEVVRLREASSELLKITHGVTEMTPKVMGALGKLFDALEPEG